MTASDLPRFRQAYADLCAAFNRDPDPDQAGVWFARLMDLELAHLEAAMVSVSQTAHRMPAIAAVRVAADEVRLRATHGSTTRQVAAAVARGEYCCGACEDSGFVPVTDAGRILTIAGSLTWRNEHGYRAKVRRCACWASNPVLLEARQARGRYAPKDASGERDRSRKGDWTGYGQGAA